MARVKLTTGWDWRTLSKGAPVHPTYTKMKIVKGKSVETTDLEGAPGLAGGYVSWRYLEMHKHTGTHIDAPSHFTDGGQNEDDLIWEQLVGPINLMDVRKKVK